MVIQSPSAAVTIPDTPLTPFVLRRERQLNDRASIINGLTGDITSFADPGSSIRRAASGFISLGVGKGDVVALYAPNSLEYVIAFHAISYIGGAVTTINPLYTREELLRQISDSGAKLIVTVPKLVEAISTSERPSGIEQIVTFGDVDCAISFGQLLEHPELDYPIDVDVDRHIVALPYSSGTTGLAKGVMITHKNLVAPAELEALFLSNPKIADVAVIGAPDEECGEIPIAYGVKNGEVDSEDIIHFVASKVAPFK
ncbi:MAG: AMP-binding protein, partial [bacterium]